MRLLTLTGPGGTGKTRLALQAAAELIDDFPDGVFFVALAPITDPGLVAAAIAQALGLTETPADGRLRAASSDYLARASRCCWCWITSSRCSAAPLVADCWRPAPGLRCSPPAAKPCASAASRLPGAAAGAAQPGPTCRRWNQLAHIAAVRTLRRSAPRRSSPTSRSPRQRPGGRRNLPRLDGLPLAIELAAARVKLLSPQAMLARLDQRLDFLTGGARDLPARQQTLRERHRLELRPAGRSRAALFRQLSVFVGGWTLEAAEAVAGDDPARRLDSGSVELVLDKSLLRQVEGTTGEPRFVMLERCASLARGPGSQRRGPAISRRHLGFFLALAEQAEASLESAEQVHWMDRMEQEHDNLRAALEWSRTAEGAAEMCLRLASALGLFWEVRGHFSEGRDRLAAMLATQAAQGRTAARARLLARSAELAYRQSDYPATIGCQGEPGHQPRNWIQAGGCLRADQARQRGYGGGRLCDRSWPVGRGAGDLARAWGTNTASPAR